jgi:hypothetical protein
MSEDVKPYYTGRPSENPTPEELRALIAQTGLSQRKAAEELGLSERMMRYYASGQEVIPKVVIYALRWLVSQEHGRANALVDMQTGVVHGPTSAASLLRDGPGPRPAPHSARGVAEASTGVKNLTCRRCDRAKVYDIVTPGHPLVCECGEVLVR